MPVRLPLLPRPGTVRKLRVNPRTTHRTVRSNLRNAPADRPTTVRATDTAGGTTDITI